MLFRSATSVAILACAASAAANPQPYKLAVMPVAGMGLSRRDTLGYQPEESDCAEGNTCAEACGAGFAQCPSEDEWIHCFNPEAAQKCCNDGTGNSCETGYYCTHDTKLQTWCCPDSMDLAECAAAYNVKGGLETPEIATTSSTSTSTSSSTSTSTSTTSEQPKTTSTPAPTTTPKPEPEPETTTTPPPTSSSTTTPCLTSTYWTTANSTITGAETTTAAGTPPPVAETPAPPPPAEPTGAASASGVSLALLVAAAGFVTLF